MSLFTTLGNEVKGYGWEQAIEKADLNWTVSKRPIYVAGDEDTIPCHSTNKFFATTRDDNNAILGVVGPDYQVLQNSELAYMCERIQGPDVQIETAGSLNGGTRVWIQMKGDPFEVGPKKDVNYPYAVLTNGHNGMWPTSITPTSYRVICQNTLNMALSEGRKKGMIITFKHTGNMAERIENLIVAMEGFKEHTTAFQSNAEYLGNRSVTTEMVQNFWTQVYVNMFGNIHSTVTNDDQEQDNKTAISTMTKWANTFDIESPLSGANMWTAVNAVTNWIDHGQIYRGSNKTENRFNDILFGNGAKEKINVLNRALQFA